MSDLDVRFTTQKSLFGKVKDSFHAVKSTNFSLDRGETLGIVGESGSGKTTIGHALLKLTSSSGGIQLAGEELGSLTQKQFRPWRKRIQIVFRILSAA